MESAVNPSTGEVVFLVNNQWVKPTDTAKNETGDTAFLVGNQWQIVKSAAPTPKASTPPPAMDALGNVIGEGAEEKFGNQKAASFDLIKDLAKQFAAPIAAAPFQLPKGAELGVKGLARQSMEGNPENLMPASVYQPGLDTEESLFGKETPQQTAQRKLQAQRAVAEVPSIPYAEQLSGFGQKVQRSIQNSLSEESKKALQNSAITGNILKGEVDFGKDPTVRGYALQIANVLGSTAPSLLTSIVTKSPALGGAVGGTMAADEAGQNAAEYINKMSDVELLQKSPFFSEMVAGGASSKEARALTIQKAAESGAALQGMAATFGDALTGKLVTGAFDDIIRKVAGSTKVGRAAGTGTLAGLEESMQETGEGIGSDIGIKSVIKSKEIGEDSAANAVLGFLGGAGPGGARGLMVQGEQPAAIPSAEQMMRERGFLVPEQQARPPVTPPSAAAERIEPTLEPEVKAAPEPTDLAKERAEEQRRVLELEKELEAPEAAPIAPQEVTPAPEAVTPEEPTVSEETTLAGPVVEAAKPAASGTSGAYTGVLPSDIDYDTPSFRLQQADVFGQDLMGELSQETESYGRVAIKKKSLTNAYAEKKETLGNAIDAANVAFGSGDFAPFAQYMRLYPKTAAKLRAHLNSLKVAKPTLIESPQTAISEEEAIPFFGEDLTGKPMPDRPEVQELLTQAEEASKAAEQLSKRTAGTSLIKVLQGSLKDSEMSKLGGRSRQVGKNPFMSLVAKKGKPGSSMEDMVDSGALDLFLPEKMRPGHPMYDNYESAAYIREKLIQGQYYTNDTQMEIDRVTEGIWDLDKLINEELSIDDINKEIQLAFDEQREADLATEEAVPESKAGAAPAGERTEVKSDFLKAQTAEELKAKQDEIDRLQKENDRLAKEAEQKAKADEQVGNFTLTGSDREADQAAARGQKDIFAEAAEPETVAISPEQERKDALEQLERQLKTPVPPFRAVGVKKTQILKPAPLTNLQIKEILQLASDALDLGLPAAVLGNVKGAGSTKMKAGGVMSEQGWLMIGSQWKGLSSAGKLHTLAHELGHSVDFRGDTISYKANWSKAETELKNWYAGAANKFNHPFRYPYAPQYKGSVDYEMESFAEAFAHYFTSPVDLQKNAPEAYSQIQAVIERIQDGSQKARAAGATERGTAGIKIQPSRTEKSTAVQPNSGAVGTGVGRVAGIKNQSAGKVSSERVNASVGRTIFNQKPLVNWTAPEMTSNDKFIYNLQNRHIDTKRVIDEIAGSIGEIDDNWNPYLMEELFHGRAAKQTKDFLVNELRPLLKEMDRLGVTIPELEEYLHNKHAEERNIQVAKVNPTLPDEGSGIKTADARAYLANLSADQKAKLDQADRMVKIITSNTRQMLVDSGLESQNTIDTWDKTYGDYVPLNRDDVDYSSQQGKSVGQGYSVRGSSSKRAAGSTRKVVDILANIAMQRERTIVRAEKNRVATALYGLALKSPNPKFWLAVNPDSKKDMQATANELVNMGLPPQDAQNLMKEPTQTVIDPKTGLVTKRVNPVLRGADNVMSVRVNGKDRFIFFNQNNDRAERMVTALKNLDADQLGWILSNSAKVTRFFASINTQYNPVFGIYNFLRDTEGAVLQLTTTELADKQPEVLKQVMPAVRGIYAQLRADHQGKVATGQWSKLWEEFQQQGGQTGFRDQFSRSEERGLALERELKKMSQGKASDAKDAVLNWLSDYNETMENAVRLAAYKTGLDNGLSKAKAASLAKNLTVNFNRKGQWATQANALYAFFNSAVQGTTRLGQTIAGPAGKLIIGGGMLAGVIQAVGLSMAGFGDDDPPDFIKDKSFIIPLPSGKYLAFPMPLGYNVIPSATRIITEGVMAAKDGRKVDAGKRIEHLLGLFADAFNPIGNAGWSMQTLAPTPIDWYAALRENKDWTGKPIAKEDFNKLKPTPGYLRAKESATIFGKKVSEFLNYASGGNADVPGVVSPTPDQIDYLVGQATGGLGREIMKTEQTLRSVVTGEELPPHKLPLVGRFYGDTKGSSSVANHFYDNLKRMNEYENAINGMAKRQENVAKFLADNPEAALYKMADKVEKNVQQLRKLRHTQVENDAPKKVVQGTEKLITDQMLILNEQIEKLEKQRTNK